LLLFVIIKISGVYKHNFKTYTGVTKGLVLRRDQQNVSLMKIMAPQIQLADTERLTSDYIIIIMALQRFSKTEKRCQKRRVLWVFSDGN